MGTRPGGSPRGGAASLLAVARTRRRQAEVPRGLAAAALPSPCLSSPSPERARRRVPAARSPLLCSRPRFPRGGRGKEPPSPATSPAGAPAPWSWHPRCLPRGRAAPCAPCQQQGASPGCVCRGAAVFACPPLARQPVGNSPALAESPPWHFLPGGKGRERQRRSPKPGRTRVRPLPSTTSGKDGLNLSGEETAARGRRAARGGRGRASGFGPRCALGAWVPSTQGWEQERQWQSQGGFAVPG